MCIRDRGGDDVVPCFAVAGYESMIFLPHCQTVRSMGMDADGQSGEKDQTEQPLPFPEELSN